MKKKKIKERNGIQQKPISAAAATTVDEKREMK
jgi:hypothetical protein